jgi:hypothetical protein
MLSGHVPFSGSFAQVLSQHLTKPPPLDVLLDLPPDIRALVGRMLAKNPEDRFRLTLLELMKRRRVLPLREALVLLERIAAKLDALQSAALPCPALTLGDVIIEPPELFRSATR